MKSAAICRHLVPAIVLAFVCSSLIWPQAAAQATQAGQTVVTGKKVTVEGVIVKRDADTFTLRSAQGNLVVTLSNETQVKEKKSNPFRGGRNYATTQLLRGLSVEVTGRQDATGKIAA